MTVFLSKDHNEDVYSFNVGTAIHEMIDLIGLWQNLDIIDKGSNGFVKKDLVNFCRYSRNYIRSKVRKICRS